MHWIIVKCHSVFRLLNLWLAYINSLKKLMMLGQKEQVQCAVSMSGFPHWVPEREDVLCLGHGEFLPEGGIDAHWYVTIICTHIFYQYRLEKLDWSGSHLKGAIHLISPSHPSHLFMQSILSLLWAILPSTLIISSPVRKVRAGHCDAPNLSPLSINDRLLLYHISTFSKGHLFSRPQ